MEKVRNRYPQTVPVLVNLPSKKVLKLLVPLEANVAFLNGVCRKKLSEVCDASVGLFLIHGKTVCSGTTRIASLDTNKPDAVSFHARYESTFG
jgi:hypothetical protein